MTEDYLLKRVVQALKRCDQSRSNAFLALQESNAAQVKVVARVAAEEMHSLDDLKKLSDTLADRLDSQLKAAASDSATTDPDTPELIIQYKELYPMLTGRIEHQTDLCYALRLKHLELKTQLATKADLEAWLSEWTRRELQARKTQDERLTLFAGKCVAICQSTLSKH